MSASRAARRAAFLPLAAISLLGLPAAASAVDLSYTNPAGIYTVTASDTGNFAMKTGPNHPNGAGLLLTFTQGGRNLLYSYSSGTYYPFAQLTTNKPTLSNITNGVQVSGNLNNAPAGGTEQLHVEEDLTVSGTTREDSAIFETLRVRNDGASPIQIGARTAIDFKLANDDGPAFTPEGGSALTAATRYTNPAYPVFYLNDNNGTNPTIPTAPTLRATWSAGPNDFGATPADILEMADYGVKANQPLVPTLPLANTKINADNEVRWIWGPDGSSARTIAPGATVTFSIATSMGALNAVTPTNQHPPVISGSTTQGQVLTASQGDWNDTTGLTAFHYQWQRCGAQGTGCVNVADATDSTYTTTADDLGSTMRVAVTAGSSAAATSDASDVIHAPDTTPPDAPTLIAAPSGTTAVNSAVIEFTGAEPGGTFECSVDGAAFTACSSPYTAGSLADGPHTFAVRQVDAAGNTGAERQASWTVDTTAPAAPTVTDAPDDHTTATTAHVTFTGEQGATFTSSLDGGTDLPATSPIDLTGLAPGVHTLVLKQIDAAGNVSVERTVTWTVEVPPTPTTPTATTPDTTPTPTTPAPTTPTATTPAPDTTPAPAVMTTPETAPAPAPTAVDSPSPAGAPAAAAPAAVGFASSFAGASRTAGASVAAITVDRAPVTVDCQTTGTLLSACGAQLYASVQVAGTSASKTKRAATTRDVLVGTGQTKSSAGSDHLQIKITLNATGRALLRRRPLGLNVSANVAGQPVSGAPVGVTTTLKLLPAHAGLVLSSFAVGSAQLPAAVRGALSQLANQLPASARLRVVGHTTPGADDAVRHLARARAKAAQQYLIARGVHATWSIAGRGDAAPWTRGSSTAAGDRNRRVALLIDRK